MDLPEFLYHGTSTAYLDQILRDGLHPHCSYRRYLCYTDEIEIATHHATFMADLEDEPSAGLKPIVFKIHISRFACSAFCVDKGFVELGASSGRAVDLELERQVWTWRALLHVAGSVGYRKIMKVHATDYEIVDEVAA